MPNISEYLLRTVPLVGSLLLAAYCLAYSRDYVYRQKANPPLVEDPNDAELYSFYAKMKSRDSGAWENKRVYREWEAKESK
ncbi:unnamed protein product [Schistocephalus solidus]|uniref:Cytochrome c oxidase assembly protein COX16, mitochondrial n=1 Tax=Schistocephalus solidus TaxID=70667 RepID=A0A183TAN4_SCHSO|nr:unnamed protein product [Schistocephalus solidus]